MDPLVSVSWLAAHLRDTNVVVLDASLPLVGVHPAVNVHARYREGHIPGTVFFDIEALSDKTTTLPHMLPSAKSFAESMSALGVSDHQSFVVYEQEGVFSAPRAWWMLRTMGVEDVRVLDGGLPAWKDAGHNVDNGNVRRPKAVFRASLQAEAVRSFSEMQAITSADQEGEQVLDARSAGRFRGVAPEPRAGLRSGHMPSAINVPYTDVVRNGHLKDADDLRAVFNAAGVNLGRPITTTCGSGVTAAVLALALERCGVAPVKLYDGSWTEYGQHPDAVVLTD